MELLAFYLYLVFINVLAVVVCITDKARAKKGKRRIPEKTLFTISVLGGAFAMYIVMLRIRHKTHHKRFMITLPIIIVIQLVLLLCALNLLA